MGRVGSFFFGMIVGATVLGVAMHYHIVRGKDGIFVVPKVHNNLTDIYVDTRQFTLSDWQQHRMLAVSILRRSRRPAARRIAGRLSRRRPRVHHRLAQQRLAAGHAALAAAARHHRAGHTRAAPAAELLQRVRSDVCGRR